MRGRAARAASCKPTLDEMGPGVEAIPDGRDKGAGDRSSGDRAVESEPGDKPTADMRAGEKSFGPRSKLGRPGQRGGFKPRGR